MLNRILGLLLSTVALLTTSLTSAAAPSFQLAYFYPVSDITHCSQVTISSLDGTLNQQFKLPITNGCMTPLWSPDGQYLAIYHPGMMLIDTQTGDIQVLNDLSAGMLVDSPIWSRDSHYLTWHEQRGGTGTDPIWKLLNISDKTVKTVTALSEASIAPDTLQFMRMERDGLYTIGTDLTPQRIALPQTMDCTSSLAWSGLLSVCVEAHDLVLLDTLSGKSSQLTHTPDLQESNPQWSPDKQQIVYQVYDPVPRVTWLALMASDGSNVRRLTYPASDTNTPVFMVSAGNDVFPTWSPDGQYIAFQRSSGYNGLDMKLYVIKADGSDLHSIGDGMAPAWRPLPKSE